MLVDYWNEVVAQRSDELAILHPDAADGFTFLEIEAIARKIDTSPEIMHAIGSSVMFLPTLIAAWKAGKPVLLLENETSIARPIGCEIPPGTALIKQTCGASGVERSLFFTSAQVLAEGLRNINGLGLHPARRGIAAISLAHSYGFGCLALPFLLAGVPIDVVAGPLPMMMDAALGRGGEVFLPGVPAIWKTWSQTGIAAHPSISLALSAGSPLSLELENSVSSECGLKIHNFYGTSETGAIAFDASAEPRRHQGFVGDALPGIDVSTDKTGRIIVSTDSCSSGSDVPACEGEFEGAYLTLDQGEVSGRQVFVNRCIGRAINVAGRKVSPNRLRSILETLPGVKLAAIERGFSRDFERFEEIRVRLSMEGDFDKKALREQLRQKVESWEMPRSWEFERAD